MNVSSSDDECQQCFSGLPDQLKVDYAVNELMRLPESMAW
jgi:hypothetical protein